jgi:hypothetical protein
LTSQGGTVLDEQVCADGEHACREAAGLILRRGELSAGDTLHVRHHHATGEIHAPRETD